VLGEYDRLVDEYGLEVVNAVGSITEQQRVVRSLVAKLIVTDHSELTDDEPV
jgi:hypothetical protein